MKGLTLVKVKALDAFTKTTKHGQFHGDPDSERNAHPKVPDYVVQELVDAHLVERVTGGAGVSIGTRGRRLRVDPLDHDDNGRKGGTPSAGASIDAGGGFSMRYKPVGSYEITGPGMAEPEIVKGRKAAEARIAELRAGSGSDGAPPAD